MRHFSAALAAAVLLSGCANIIDKPFQKIRFETPGVEGADCSVRTPRRQYRVITPDSITVDRGEDTLEVTCEKGNYHTARLRVESALNPSTLWNVFNGVIPGTAYDVASNAVYEYPREIIVPMEPDLEAMAGTALPPAAEPPPRRAFEPSLPRPAAPESEPAGEIFTRTLQK